MNNNLKKDKNSMDSMDVNELYGIGIQIISYVINNDGFEIVFVNRDDKDNIPTFVCKKDGNLYFIVVEVDIQPKKPVLSPLRRFAYISHASKFKAKPLYASISIGSANPQHFKDGVVLKGDGCMPLFTGFEEVTLSDDKEDYLYHDFFLLSKIFDFYNTGDKKLLKEFLRTVRRINIDSHLNGGVSHIIKRKEAYLFFLNDYEVLTQGNNYVDLIYCMARVMPSIIWGNNDVNEERPAIFIGRNVNGMKKAVIISCILDNEGNISEIDFDPFNENRIRFAAYM